MHRREVTFVVAPNHRAEDLEIKVADATTDATCKECGHALDPYEEARKRGREFTEMIMGTAHGGFWDGMRDTLKRRGYIRD